MPPIKFKDPKPVYLKAPRGRIVALSGPDVKLGKSMVANAPHRVSAVQLDKTRSLLRRFLGSKTEIRYNVFATYGVTRKPEGTGMNQGKGHIDHFVARIPAGKTIVHLPGWLAPFNSGGFGPQRPIFDAFRKVAQNLPMPVHFRSQSNNFPLDRFDNITRMKLRDEATKRFEEKRQRLGNPHCHQMETLQQGDKNTVPKGTT
eukprot:GHVS01061331.1.p1 GENE.GHVS01061331.1~~GHVS01061331.1.p1  ORF type:complete len:202 (-),score=10.66 GHVS01061331.1:121-726(-)